MKELSTDARSILDAARGVDEPTPDDRARVKRAVMTSVAAGAIVAASATAASKAAASTAAGSVVGSAAGSTAAAVAGTTTAAGVAGLGAVGAKALVALTFIGATVGVAVVQPWEPSEATQVEASETVEPTDTVEPAVTVEQAEQPSVQPVVVEEPIEPPQIVEVAEPDQAVPAPRIRPVTRVDPAREPSTLRAETALLGRAARHMREGEHAQVLQISAEHDVPFPRGALRVEFRALKAISLCALGRTEEGLAIAQSVGGRSIHAARLREVCRL